MIVLPVPPPTRSSALPHGVRIVESNQPLAVRCVHWQRIAQPVRPLRSRFRSHHDELHPVSDVIREQRLVVKVEQRVQPGTAVRHRHLRRLSISDTNERLGPRLLVAENDREPRAENPPELFSKPFAEVLAAAVDGGHVSVRRAAALVGLPIEGLEELFAIHRVEHVIDL